MRVIRALLWVTMGMATMSQASVRAETDGFPVKPLSPMLAAVEVGDAEKIRSLLDDGVDIDETDAHFITPLKYAAGRGDTATVRLLLDSGAATTTPIDRRDPTGSALHRAVWMDATEVAKLLLDRGAPIESANKFGERPLHMAARRNNVAMARLLLDRGAAPSAEADAQATPLHGAAYNGAVEVIELLVDRGADIHRHESAGATPLFIAAQLHRPRAVKALLKAGAGVNGRVADGRTVLHLAVSLVEAEGDADDPDLPRNNRRDGHAADALATVRLLLDVGADPNAQVPLGWRVLEAATTNGTPDIVALLMARGADPNLPGAEGKVALHHAARRGDVAMIRTLVAGGASVDRTCAVGMTPLRYALWEDPPQRAAAQELAVHGAKVTLNTAVIIGHKMTRSMLDSEPAELSRLRGGTTNTLLIAAARAEPEVLTLLLAEGAKVELVNPRGWTALHAAIGEGRLDNLRQLLEYGADPNRITGQGDHPIDLARQLRRDELVDTLRAYGAVEPE